MQTMRRPLFDAVWSMRRACRAGQSSASSIHPTIVPAAIRTKKTAASHRDRPKGQQPFGESIKMSGNSKSLWKSWNSLSVSSRLSVAFIFAVIGAGGLMVSNYLEERLPADPSGMAGSNANEPHKARLFGIRVIDKQT